MSPARRRLSAAWLALSVAACGGPSGQDAAVPSADAVSIDAAPTCASDDDCDDGLACNGDEQCASGRCQGGVALDCDDGISCTTDFCSEELRRCVNQAVDADRDGVPAASCLDARGMPLGDDCDDDDPGVYPGAPELCDAMGVDEDCEPSTLGERDGDGDGYVDIACCNGSVCGEDCNDAVPGARPGGTEVCNGLDDDCDGMVDEGVLVTTYRDVDGDGHGDPATERMGCPGAAGYVALGDDCDDTSALRSPTLFEVCDGIDNDCDGIPDPTDAPIVSLWYADGDGDGFGDPGRFVESCARPMGDWSLLGTDCDDTDPSRHPAQAEQCNGLDDDCNGVADYEIAPGDTEDDDRDGRADANCLPRPATPDCDDRDASSSGDSPEVCDGRDNDCDGRTDEGMESTPLYRDEDGDGYGSTRSGVIVGCGAAPGYSARDGDCDDGSSIRNPGALEGCNGVDDDCDTRVDEDPTASFCPADQVCLGGRCRERPTCAAGYADCDGVRANGCESFLATDPLNCGVCSRRCPSEPGARSSCVASRCMPIACDSAYLDCNGNLGRGRDGCEHPASCGPCGTLPSMEICGNGLDDDCDGMLDEGCACTPGGACTTTCGSSGTVTCGSGGAATCTAPAEMCNGRDDDCDGVSDEGCCTPGGSCRTDCGSSGTTTCGPMGTPGTCMAPAETCNGRDDDCDMRTDESMAAPLMCGNGACARTAPACDMGRPGVCTPGAPGVETCNALDDDCDGATDEGFGAPVVCGVGACQRTVPGCAVGGMMMTCTPGTPVAEACNGLDDDCDGTTDETFGTLTCGTGACRRMVSACIMGVPQVCTPGAPSGETCDGNDNDCDTFVDEALGSTTCGAGLCQRTTANCVGGFPQSCVAGMPLPEICNALDDDCDSSADESLGTSTCGLGICQRTQPTCVAGAPNMCVPGPPSMELCNALDDDCDGMLNNGCPASIGIGAMSVGPSFGTATGSFGEVNCGPGQAVVGATGYTGALVDRVQLTCQPITVSVDMLRSPDYGYPVVPSGGTTMTGFLGGAGGSGPVGGSCPGSSVAIGIYGGSGASVDQLGLRCAPIELVRMGASFVPFTDFGMGTDTTPVGPATGTPYGFLCGPGEVLVGLEGYTLSWLRQVTPHCAPILISTL